MIDFIWGVLCARSIIDQGSNNISMIDVVEQITLSPEAQFPVNIVYPFQLVSLWSRSDYEQPAIGRARIIVFSPSDEEIHREEIEIDLTSFRRLRHRLGFQGLPISETGKFVFQVEQFQADGTTLVVARVPLEVSWADTTETDK